VKKEQERKGNTRNWWILEEKFYTPNSGVTITPMFSIYMPENAATENKGVMLLKLRASTCLVINMSSVGHSEAVQ
jgi:hypothetical protein